MKQHIFTRGGFLLAVMSVFLSFFACRQDVQVAPIKTYNLSSQEKINSAKSWFEQNESILYNGNNHDFKGMKPIWEKATAYDDIVEVPYAVNNKMPFPRISGQFKQLGKQNLILQIKDNKYEASIVSYVPFNVFKGTIESINVRNLRSETFEGTVSTQGWDQGEFRRWHYENGNIIKETVGKRLLRENAFERNVSCTLAYEDIDQYTVFSVGGVIISVTYDGTIRVYTMNCVYSVGSSGGCTGPFCSTNNNNGGGGSGSSSSNCNGRPCEPCELDPTMPECRRCHCAKQSEKISAAWMSFDPLNLNTMFVEILLTGMDCKTGNAVMDLVYTSRCTVPSGLTTSNDFVRQYYKSAPWRRNPDCGHTVTYYTHGIVTCNVWIPSQNGLPAPVTFDIYRNAEFN